jgi:hypothetical protein
MKIRYFLAASLLFLFIGCASTLTHYELGMQYYENGET